MKIETEGPFTTQLRVGIVGFGGAGIAQLRHFREIPGCQVIAIYDPKAGGLDRARAAAPAVYTTDNFQKFMSSGINTIAVCSPDKTHADYVVAALEAGMHVVCEKPLTDSLEGCRRILDIQSKAKGVVAAVQHQMRFLPVHLEMKRLLESGQLGRISYIEGYYVHNLTTRAALYDDWRFTDNATPLVYAGCHFVDLFRWLLDDEVEEVMGMANNIAFPEYPESDLNVILLRFKSGIIGKVVIAFGAGRPQDHSVRVYGSEMSLENNLLFSKAGDHRVFARPDLPPKKRRHIPASTRPFYAIRGRGYWWRVRSAVSDFRHRLPRYRTYSVARLSEWLMRIKGHDHGYEISAYPIRLYPHELAVRASLENFVRSVQGHERLHCSLSDAARTVITCLAGVEAYRTGRTVKVADYWLPEFDRESVHSDTVNTAIPSR
jgi:predicted dehydrogenase